MNKPPLKISIFAGVLGSLTTAAVIAIVITYFGYLPTIKSVPLQEPDRWLGEQFYLIAVRSFFISGVSCFLLGLSIPALIQIFRRIYGNNNEPIA